MMYVPSGVGSRVGGALRSSDVVMVSEERKEFGMEQVSLCHGVVVCGHGREG